jgi:hypothetical protein
MLETNSDAERRCYGQNKRDCTEYGLVDPRETATVRNQAKVMRTQTDVLVRVPSLCRPAMDVILT